MRKYFPQASSLFVLVLLLSDLGHAQDRLLRILVVDLEGKPVPRVELSARGASSAGITQDDGKATIVLTPQTTPNSEIKLYIVAAPKDYVFISPWDAQVRVPPFDDATPNSTQVVLAEKGIRSLLEDSRALVAAAETVKKVNEWRVGKNILPKEKRVETLKTVAEAFGLDPNDLDQALRELEEKAKDPYEKGQSASYSGNYQDAEKYLRESAQIREQQIRDAESNLADTQFALAGLLFKQERYDEALIVSQQVLSVKKDDSDVMTVVAVSMLLVGRHREAEPLLMKLLELRTKEYGVKSEEFGTVMYLRALNYVGLKKLKEAEDILTKLYFDGIGSEGDREDYAFFQMVIYFIRGEFSKAENIYAKTGGLASDDPNPKILQELQTALGLTDEQLLVLCKGILMTIDRERIQDDLSEMENFLDYYASLLRKNNKTKEALMIEKRAKDFRTEQKRKNQEF